MEDEDNGERGPPVPPPVIISSDSDNGNDDVLQWSPFSLQDVLVSMCVRFFSIAHNYNIVDCLTFCVSISISIFVLPFEWPQTLQALWAFMRSLLLTLMLYCLQFSI